MQWTEEDRALLVRVDRARRRAAAPLEALRKNPDRTGRGQAISLYNFLEGIGLPERLEERVERLIQRRQLTLAEEYRQLWDILCGGLEQCARLLESIPMELEEFALLFRLVLTQYDVGTIPVSLDRVTAGETTRQTGRRVEALFLLGADDASLPQVGTTPGLLSDDDRSLLAGYGPGNDYHLSDLCPAGTKAGGDLVCSGSRRRGAPAQLFGKPSAVAV